MSDAILRNGLDITGRDCSGALPSEPSDILGRTQFAMLGHVTCLLMVILVRLLPKCPRTVIVKCVNLNTADNLELGRTPLHPHLVTCDGAACLSSRSLSPACQPRYRFA